MTPHQPLFEIVPAWRTLFWVSWSAWLACEIWVFARDLRSAAGEVRDRGSRAALVALIAIGVWLAFTLAYTSGRGAIAGPPAIIFFTGVALIWIGVVLRAWAVITLGRFFRTVVMLQDEHRLVTNGPYRVLRNPAYTGTLITVIGLGAAMGGWLSVLAGGGGVLLGYAVRIPVEERALRARFGDVYAQWAKRTWSLIPLVW